FRREARSAAGLLHPNIAGIFDYGEDAGRWYIVIEYVQGENLADRLTRQGRLTWEQAFTLAAQAAAALEHAHARGVVHRDVKPPNILLTGDGVAKVTDFGIARTVRAATTLTQTGSLLGTPAYLAPELAQGERAGPAADLYALGVVLFELVTGGPPYRGETSLAIAMQHVTAPVPDPRERGAPLPEAAARLIVRALAKRPEDRFPSAASMRQALERCLADAAADATL